MRTSTTLWGVVCFSLCACAHGEPAAPQTSPPAAGWRHPQASARIAAMGPPRHSAVDAIANPGAPVVLEAKLAYGPVSKDLEDEDVTAQIWIDGEWREAGRAITDDDGRARVTTAAPTGAGRYRFAFVVAGD